MTFNSFCSDFRLNTEERKALAYHLAFLRAASTVKTLLGADVDWQRFFRQIATR